MTPSRVLGFAKPLDETALIQFKHINLWNVWSRFRDSKPQSPEYDVRVDRHSLRRVGRGADRDHSRVQLGPHVCMKNIFRYAVVTQYTGITRRESSSK
jgi:hypothetical protein